MPGESASITTELNHADTRDQRPAVVLSGFNIASTEKETEARSPRKRM
jgi:hypothetical protein